MQAPYTIERARIAPVPPQPLEVWIGASAPPAIDRAARLGDAFLVGPEATPAQARELIELYREACARHGRTPATIAIRRDVHVGENDADTERVAGPVLARGYRGFDPAAPVTGSPQRVIDAFGELEAMGYTDVIVRHLADDHTEVLKSFTRLKTVREALQ
jgi:alkanesulfonate monooxygenase SsuD/methylene tetrahydromethanopterin reductase-like flavin-dependent oxidoreductase (luciferase family)